VRLAQSIALANNLLDQPDYAAAEFRVLDAGERPRQDQAIGDGQKVGDVLPLRNLIGRQLSCPAERTDLGA
jgi:hypothetical protein